MASLYKWRADVVVGDRLPRSRDARNALVQQRLGLHGDGDRQPYRRGSTRGRCDKRWRPPLVHRQSLKCYLPINPEGLVGGVGGREQ